VAGANIVYVANPNSPSGTSVSLEAIERLAAEAQAPVVVDEAYADFAGWNALPLARAGRALVTRTLSKSYSLAGIRFGFAVAAPEMVQELVKVKDSYNCDVLSLAAAAAALEDQAHMQATRARVLATRARLERDLAGLGFAVVPSQANFVWARRDDRPVKPIFEELKRRNILVRYMVYEGHGDGLRVSVGTDAEIDRLMAELRAIV
jgi:histidinol-phosphate aminotransferase